MNLSEMSRSELEQLKADVEKAIVAAADRDRKEALVAARNAAAEFGFSLATKGLRYWGHDRATPAFLGDKFRGFGGF